MDSLSGLLERFYQQPPQITFEWNDRETEARGWIVINSLKNGAAGGGTRMRKGLSRDEVLALAKVMEIKFSVSGPPIGGAKSGIDFNPNDPRREGVLRRWFHAVYPILKTYYGTGGDLNVDEIRDVIPITQNLGLWHPQEGIVNGHLLSGSGEKVNILGQLRYGCSKILEDAAYAPDGNDKYAVADMITGYGVAESVVHYYDIFHHSGVRGKRAIIQGWGNVASAAAYYLSQSGVRIVGIIDLNGGLIEPDGFGFEEIRDMFLQKAGNRLHTDKLLPFEEVQARIWSQEAEIFIPGAASRLVTREQADRLLAGELEVISCGANVPFVDDEFLFGPTAEYLDDRIALIPDFIANCGMARVFAYLMSPGVPITDSGIFGDVSATIKSALKSIYLSTGTKYSISQNALRIALQSNQSSKKLVTG